MPKHTQVPVRFWWSRRNSLHIGLVKSLNRIAGTIPAGARYRLTHRLRHRNPPYSLINEGDVVVQVGAPADTLRGGRQRAMHLAMRVGPSGTVIVIEPDIASARALRSTADCLKMPQIKVIECGAWSHEDELELLVDPEHPAANFIEGCADYPADALTRFERVQVPVRPIDDIIAEETRCTVKLVSITTNGAEVQILAGLCRTIEQGLPFIALARTSSDLVGKVGSLGYDFLTHDDRGFVFNARS